ncbi:MAG: phosphate ABC transporter permease PstA [Acidimicrobiia bacterium]|nr:phosphate ABC transporter permease PstA [Acidimicrobiia bacterium]
MALGTLGDRRTKDRVAREIMNRKADPTGALFQVAVLFALLLALAILVLLLQDVVRGSWPVLSERPGDFLSAELRTRADETGVFQPLRGTFWIGVFVVVLAFPIGIGAAIYLEEYATDNRFSRFVDLNIRNLAGVPSVVYGILGFTIFVRFADGFFPGSVGDHAGKTTAAAGVTLAVLVLPIVIITSSEAIRAVPRELRDGAFGMGATKSQAIRSQILPYAAPGILTGTLLSLTRALGEAAPLILVGAVTGKLGPNTGFLELEQLGEKFTALPITIANFAGRPGEDWEQVTSAAIVVLLVMVLMANAVAILLRNRYEKKRR